VGLFGDNVKNKSTDELLRLKKAGKADDHVERELQRRVGSGSPNNPDAIAVKEYSKKETRDNKVADPPTSFFGGVRNRRGENTVARTFFSSLFGGEK
jgi:hypothetical protein